MACSLHLVDRRWTLAQMAARLSVVVAVVRFLVKYQGFPREDDGTFLESRVNAWLREHEVKAR